ncbi:MAG: SCO family protein [Gemmatimonadales bacterium]
MNRPAGVAGIITVTIMLACTHRDPYAIGELRGTQLDSALPKPDFSLTATSGQSYEFAPETHGHLTLLLFGYTNCPDVCPIHMANLAAVVHQLPPDIANQIKVVMVSTDPERDSLHVLRKWLDKFDHKFVGLRGSLDEVNTIQRGLGLPPSVRLSTQTDYDVGHAAQVIAFTRDDSAHVVYPFGTRQSDWAHDLPLLLRSFGATQP